MIRWSVFFAATLLVTGGSPGPARAEILLPETVAAAALTHARTLQMANDDIRAAVARERLAAALGRPSFWIDGRFAQYDGLQPSTLGPGLVMPEIEDRYSVGAAAVQPIFTGGRIPRGREAAAYERRAVEESRRALANDLVLAAHRQYWAWAKAREAIDVRGQSVLRLEAHASDVRRRKSAGLATEREQLAAEVRMEQTRLRLQEARRAEALARARLGWLTGHEPGMADEPLSPGKDLDRSAPANIAPFSPAARPEAAAAEQRRAAARAKTAQARADGRPQMSLVARYDYARPNSLFFPLESEWNGDASIALVASWSLWDGGQTAARTAEAAARAERAGRQVEQMLDDLRLEQREAEIDLCNALERVTVAERGLESALRNRASAADQWKAGLARQTEVLDAESDWAEAAYEVTAAGADLRVARAAFDRAAGRSRIPTE
jgi:outer membrane protein TolC